MSDDTKGALSERLEGLARDLDSYSDGPLPTSLPREAHDIVDEIRALESDLKAARELVVKINQDRTNRDIEINRLSAEVEFYKRAEARRNREANEIFMHHPDQTQEEG